MTNRRKFLAKTALGAGSALFLPGLLASCTDHIIPPPNTPGDIPPSVASGEDFDWNDAAKEAVTAGLGMIPEVGEILSALVDIFWPNSQENVWDQVKAQVEALIDQKIAADVYLHVSENLKGLNGLIIKYQNELKNGTPNEKLNKWSDVSDFFVHSLPYFQSKGNEFALLPLFAQFANLYLALLRDGVANGKSWGRTDADHQQDIQDLKKAINDFSNYTLNLVNGYLLFYKSFTPRDDEHNQPFTIVNLKTRQMTLTVLDYMNMWPYFDITKYPSGVDMLLPREIYSDPMGRCLLSGPINLPSSPTQGPTHLTVWAYDRIDAVQLTYPAGSGPNGVTTTPRMGDQPDKNGGGGTDQPPYGGSFDIVSNNPIVSAKTWFGDELQAMQFTYLDKSTTHLIGAHQEHPDRQDPGYYPNASYGYSGHYLSSIYINGIGHSGSADCVVYGFKYLNGSPPVSLRTLRTLYITSPKDRSAADFAQAFPTYGITASLITDELKAARKAYWDSIKVRAEALK